MSRFYKAPEVQFREDYLYQPPWEMLMGALSKKENEIQQDANTLELYKSLELLHADKDPEKAYANEIYKELEDEITNIATNMQKDFLNPAYKTQIQALKDKTRNRFRSGDIRRLQETAEGVEAFEADLLANVTDPEKRRLYREAIQNPYFEAGGSKASETPFKYEGGFYDDRNFGEEYSGSEMFKSIGKDFKESAWSNISKDNEGRYIITGSKSDTGLTEAKLDQSLLGFLQGENLEGYMNHDENYFGKKWRDENGEINLDAEGTVPYEIKQAALSKLYNDHRETSQRTADQYALEDYRQRNASRASLNEAISAAPDSNAKLFYMTPQGRKVREAGDRAILAYATQFAGISDPKEAKEYFAKVIANKDGKYDPIDENDMTRATALQIQAAYNTAERNGFKALRDAGVPAENIKAIVNGFAKPGVIKNTAKGRGQIIVGENADGTPISSNIAGKEAEVSLWEMEGKSMYLPEVGEKKITKIIPDLESPAEFVPALSVDANSEPVPGSKITVKIYYDSGTTEQISPSSQTDKDGTFILADFYVPGLPVDISDKYPR